MDRLEVELAAGRRSRGPGQVPAVPDPERGEDPPCLSNWPTGSTTGPATAICARGTRRTDPRRCALALCLRLGADASSSWSRSFTGLLLMTSYSPSSSTAWGSVFYISHEMWWAGSSAASTTSPRRRWWCCWPCTCSRSSWAGAYRRPREFNWWFGMALLFLTLGFSLTGYLLPWDQKGYWATKVATNIMGGAPVARPVPPEDRGRRRRLRQPDRHPVLRPARRRLAGLARALPGGARRAVPPPRPHAAPRCRRTADGHVLARAALHGYGLQRAGLRHRRSCWSWPKGAPTSTPRPTRRAPTIPARPGVVLPLALPDAQALPRQAAR